MNITDFEDYRDFIGEQFQKEQQRWPGFTYQYCAKSLGTTRGYLKLVTQKSRHIGIDKIPGIAKLLKLGEAERDIMLVMLMRSTSRSKDLQKYFDNVLTALKTRYRFDRKAQSQSQPECEALFENSLALAIHSLARFDNFEPSSDWISKRLHDSKIDKAQIDEAITFLIDTGSIVQTECGKYKPAEFCFRRAEAMSEHSCKIYEIGLQQILKATKRPVDFRPNQFCMLNISVDQAGEDLLVQKFIEFRDTAMAIAKKCESPTRVFMVSNNMISTAGEPLTM